MKKGYPMPVHVIVQDTTSLKMNTHFEWRPILAVKKVIAVWKQRYGIALTRSNTVAAS